MKRLSHTIQITVISISLIMVSLFANATTYAAKCEALKNLAKQIIKDISNVDEVHRMCTYNLGIMGGMGGVATGGLAGAAIGGLAGCAVGAASGGVGGAAASLAALNPASMLFTVPLFSAIGCVIYSVPGKMIGFPAGLIAGGVGGSQLFRLCTLMKSDYARCVQENPNLFK